MKPGIGCCEGRFSQLGDAGGGIGRAHASARACCESLVVGPKVPLRERSARTCLQVLLELDGLLLARKLDDDDQRPWAIVDGMPARPVVVPLQAPVGILGDTDVVAVRVRLAAEDVDEALADAVHSARHCRVGANQESAIT